MRKETIVINGRELTFSTLGLGRMRMLNKKLDELKTRPPEESTDVFYEAAEILHLSLKPNHPDLPLDEFRDDILTVSEFNTALGAVYKTSAPMDTAVPKVDAPAGEATPVAVN